MPVLVSRDPAYSVSGERFSFVFFDFSMRSLVLVCLGVTLTSSLYPAPLFPPFFFLFYSFFLSSFSLSSSLPPQGADVNAKDKDEISGLMEASIMGHVDVVKELLKVTVTPPCDAMNSAQHGPVCTGQGVPRCPHDRAPLRTKIEGLSRH